MNNYFKPFAIFKKIYKTYTLEDYPTGHATRIIWVTERGNSAIVNYSLLCIHITHISHYTPNVRMRATIQYLVIKNLLYDPYVPMKKKKRVQ